MTKKQAEQQQVAAYLRQNPGRSLRYEQIAAALGLSSQAASIALSGLLKDDVLPGLRKIGRGTYQWDLPAGTGGEGGTAP